MNFWFWKLVDFQDCNENLILHVARDSGDGFEGEGGGGAAEVGGDICDGTKPVTAPNQIELI